MGKWETCLGERCKSVMSHPWCMHCSKCYNTFQDDIKKQVGKRSLEFLLLL